MANAAKLSQREPVRMLLVGYPGAGKTGALASLANAGYKIRFIDFDGNYAPLLKFTKPEFLKNIDILTFEDKMRSGQKFIEVSGIPTAFSDALKALDRWKYVDEDGEEIDLGASKDWGNDTIVVIDGLTSMGDAAFRRVQSIMNKTPLNMTQQAWGLAMDEQNKFIEKLTSVKNRFHVIVLSHLKMIAPKDAPKDASEAVKDQAQKQIEMIPTRFFPSALGQQLPQVIGGHFPTLLLVEPEFKGNQARRMIKTIPRPELDLKLPAEIADKTLDISTGLAQIFQVLAPPLEQSLDKPAA